MILLMKQKGKGELNMFKISDKVANEMNSFVEANNASCKEYECESFGCMDCSNSCAENCARNCKHNVKNK